MFSGWYKIVVSKLVTRYWPLIISGWIGVAILLRVLAPPWHEIAADGDLAFLPASVPSSVGQQVLEEAFPAMRSRSQMVVVFATTNQELGLGDLALAFDIARRLHWVAGKNALQSVEQATFAKVPESSEALTLTVAPPTAENLDVVQAEIAVDNLTEALEIEEVLARFLQKVQPDSTFLRLPDAYLLRGQLLQRLAQPANEGQWLLDLDTAHLMNEQATPTLPSEPPLWGKHIRDVWSWRNPIVGHKLGSGEARARLINIQLDSDFTAISNIDTLNGLEDLLAELRPKYSNLLSSDLEIEISGSAAIGADMLRAAASGVRMTELVTIILVLAILTVVYRAPFLVAIPLLSIALSLIVATSLVALLARDPASSSGNGLGVFTTTRIFIVVLLFGAGTDFCLFFLARSRELLAERPFTTRRQMYRVVAKSWRSVHDALLASALTTIVGLALMWFSQFQKFQFSGPIIAISLSVTLLVCLSFTPALLSALGTVAFWPHWKRSTKKPLASDPSTVSAVEAVRGKRKQTFSAEPTRRLQDTVRGYWGALATGVVAKPRLALLLTLLILSIPAIYGFARLRYVTYDLTEELSASSPSRRGAELISRFFPIYDGSPLTILLKRQAPFASEEELREACADLSVSFYIDGVDSVRSLTDPLGDYPPGKRMGLFDPDAWRRRVLNRIARERYVSTTDHLQRRVARFDLVLKHNPFSLEAGKTLQRLQANLETEVQNPNSAWHGAQVATAGTTAGITDLRLITQSDQTRIQILVTLGVWLVLVLLLRQWVLSGYLIFTVLLSYFATLGVTYWTFSTLYGTSYSGLDWKVPLFLFVILVAVGQDYNVYLVTRIFEERRKHGLRLGVRRGLEITGGIITSCGFVMAGTFIAMTSPAVLLWLAGVLPEGWIETDTPVLRGITELGFALAFGVLLDTLVVRSILVPAFVVLWQPANWLGSRSRPLSR